MLGNFEFCNPTRLYFGPDALSGLTGELVKYGPVVQLIYGGGSIKKNGIYDKVIAILKDAGKTVVEDAGVMPNPTTDKLREGVKIARDNNVDLLLAVGGGSCCDYAKAVSVSAYCDEDPWKRYFLEQQDVDAATKIIPVGCVLTMAGTGSEMNGGSVITDCASKLKIGHVFGDNVFPKFSILNPEFTMSLPAYQVSAGVYDIFNHICEQYFSGTDDNVSDDIAEGLMRSVIRSGRIAAKDPQNYEARSDIMWAATWALNTLIAQGKTTDWMVHMIGQSVGGHTNATHGMTLAAVSPAYYRFIMQAGLAKFARFAKNVWGINTEDMSEQEAAEAGLAAMKTWMQEMGLTLRISELGVIEGMIEGIADGVFLLKGGYKQLTREDVVEVLKASM